MPAFTIPFPFLFPEPALTILFPFLFPERALAIPFPANNFPNKLAPKVPNKIFKNPPFCSFVLFLIVLVTLFSKILESSRAGTIFIVSFISSFEIIKVVVPEPFFYFEFVHQLLKQQPLLLMELKHFLLKESILSLMDLLI